MSGAELRYRRASLRASLRARLVLMGLWHGRTCREKAYRMGAKNSCRRPNGPWLAPAVLIGLWLAGTPAAKASMAGELFAGAVRPSGFSLFWNPANMAALGERSTVMLDVSGIYLHAEFDRAGHDPVSGAPFETATFTLPGADLAFAGVWTSPWPWLRLIAGGFSPRARAGTWPEDGAQRHHITTGMIFAYTLAAGLLVTPSPRFGLAASIGPVYNFAHLEYQFDFGSYANGMLGSAIFTPEDPTFEGLAVVDTAGWSLLASLGAWAEFFDGWRLGLGLTLPTTPDMRGGVRVAAPALVNDALGPEQQLEISSRITVHYPIPWTATAELELDIGPASVAALVHYQHSASGAKLLGVLSAARPIPIGDYNLLNYGLRDDLVVMLRGSYRLDKAWELGARLEYSPRAVPTELANGANLDFNMLELSGGARWQLSRRLRLAFGAAWVFVRPLTVENSLYNSAAPFDSGLSAPSMNGVFRVTAARLTCALALSW